jgi:hypothetical protein
MAILTSTKVLALRVRKAEVEVLETLELWLKAKDLAQDAVAEDHLSYLEGPVATLFAIRNQLGLPPYVQEEVDISKELGEEEDDA